MKEFFKVHKFAPEAKALIRQCQDVVTRYQRMGLRLTLRQLYYQLVTVNAIRNEEKQYKRLSSVLSDARLMGMIDWTAIEDRVRKPHMPTEFEDLEELVDAALSSYRLPRWADQPTYAELWVEKDALSGVLAPLAHEFHVPMMVNRGYSSQSAMYDAGKRYLQAAFGKDIPYPLLEDVLTRGDDPNGAEVMRGRGVHILDKENLPPCKKELYLFYLGDHDPSGEDMVRDIQERLAMYGCELVVKKLALTMDQVEEHKPPPNPAKMSDPRASKYVDEHGATSWEVDALPPDALDSIIRVEFEAIIDRKAMDEVIRREDVDKALFRKALESLRKKKGGGK